MTKEELLEAIEQTCSQQGVDGNVGPILTEIVTNFLDGDGGDDGAVITPQPDVADTDGTDAETNATTINAILAALRAAGILV